jgi:hypothetical protein
LIGGSVGSGRARHLRCISVPNDLIGIARNQDFEIFTHAHQVYEGPAAPLS